MSLPRQVAIGAQYYINKETTVAEVRAGIAAMAAAGLRLVRIFAIWDHLEPRRGEYDFRVYDALFDAAAAHDLGVIPTLFAVSPPGWMGLSDDSQALGPLEDPAYWRAAEHHVQQVVSHWRDHPALHSWILWNEPSRVPVECPAVSKRWQAWLAEHYGDLASYHQNRYRQQQSWQDIAYPAPGKNGGSTFRGYQTAVDRLRFCVDELQHWLSDLAHWVRAADPHHPLHINPHNVGQSVLAAGQSLWREGELVDFIGVSAHPPWHSTRFPAWRVPHSLEWFAALGRSASRDPQGRFWVSELQGGPTLYSAEHPSGPDARTCQRWLGHCLAAGAEAALFWCFNQRSGGYEVGEWGLQGLDGQPTARLQAVRQVAAMLEREQHHFASAKPWPATVAIIHSEDSERLQLVAGRGDAVEDPRNRHGYYDALAGAWLMSRDAGFEVMVVDEQRLIAGQVLPSSVAMVLLPAAHALSASTLAVLADWVAAGGQVMADGLCAWNDAQGCLTDTRAHAHLFAASLHDVRGLHPQQAPPQATYYDAQQFPGWWFQGVLTLGHGATALAYWDDGSVAASEHRCGSGKALRLATLFFANYFRTAGEGPAAAALRGFFATLCREVPRPALALSDPGPRHWQRRLQLGADALLFLANDGAAATWSLKAPGYTELRDLVSDERMAVQAGHAAIAMPAGASRWCYAHSR